MRTPDHPLEPDDGDDALVSADDPTAAIGGQPAPRRRAAEPTSIPRGTAIGRYLVVDRIGAGGMGEVVLAYDPELDRRVAVKLLRVSSRADPARARRRLLREAQALAKLSHPHVVSVFDVGTHGRSVFVAMEYIEGKTLEQWLQQTARPWPQIVDTLLEAGTGLAAAHAAGLVHRDFKPTNVIVGDDGRVRVLDFGLARRFETRSGTSSLSSGDDDDADDDDDDLDVEDGRAGPRYPLSESVTETGMVMGTPAYMAPEQFFGGTVDARTDQFAFCVVLYRALFSTAPFPGKTFEELGRSVERGELTEPPRASSVPRAIRAALQRGLAVQSADRFATIDDLLAALRHATARRRRRPLYATLGLGATVVTAGLGWRLQQAGPCEGVQSRLDGVWDDEQRAQVQRALSESGVGYAASVAPRVVAGLDAYADAWSRARVEACEATHVAGHQSARVSDLRVACLDTRRQDIAAVVDVLLHPDEEVMRNAIATVESIRPVEPCADAERLLAGFDAPPDLETTQAVERVRGSLAEVRAATAAGKYADALTRAQGAREQADALGYLPLTAEAAAAEGMAHERLGAAEAALAAYDDALWAAIASGHLEVQARAMIGLTSTTANHVGDLAQALRYARVADAVLQRMEDPPALASQLALTRGTVLLRARRLPEALASYERAADLAGDRAEGQHLKIAALTNIAATLGTRGDYAASTATTLRAIELSKTRLGPDHPILGLMYNNLGVTYVRAGDHESSARAQQRALEISRAALGDDHPDTARSYHNLGVALADAGKLEEALANYRRGYEIKRRTLGPRDPSTGYSANNIADALQRLGRAREALPYVEEALDIWDSGSSEPHKDAAYALSSLAEIRLALGEIGSAREAIERGLSMIGDSGHDPLEVAHLQFIAARVLDQVPDQRVRALALAEAAIASYEESEGPGRADDVDEVRAWLAAHER